MKKILFASTALVATAGIAAAEVSFSGEAEMGVVYNGTDWSVTSGATLSVSMTGETDGGLSFGADFDITAGNGFSGTSFVADLLTATTSADLDQGIIGAAVVYVEGGFGKLSAGDIDNAVDATVGGLADIGLTGLGVDDAGESLKGNSAADLLYEGTFGDVSVAASAEVNGGGDWAIAAKYAMGDYSFAAGVEDAAGNTVYAISAGASFGDFGVNALYAKNSDTGADSYGLDASYSMDAVTVTAAFSTAGAGDNYGLGVSYDLGGGASVEAGVAEVGGTTVADFGVAMTF